MIDATQRSNTHGRMIGLGQAPSNDLAESIMQIGFTQVPVIEYVTWTTNVPLTDTEVGQTFGDEIDVLQNPKTVPGIDSVDSSFVQNGTLQVDMLTVGFGFHAFGEPLSFSQIGNALSPAPSAGTAAPVSPDVFTANDQTGGLLGIPATGFEPADMEWGVADWEALWHLVNAYQFQWIMQQRYLLINELAADVCYFGPYAEAAAAGTSDVPVQPYVKTMNARYRSKGANANIFVPVNARRIGSQNNVVFSGSTGNTGLFHPTRDYDLAPATWGGLRVQGGAACCMPFRKLIRPVLLEKGIPIGMLLRVQDSYHQAQMTKFLSISESIGGTVANVAYDTNIVDPTPKMPELTLDQGANQVAGQSVQTNRVIFKGGTLKLAILVKGFEVWGPWKEYIVKNMSSQVYAPSVTGTSGAPMGMMPMLR